MGLGVELGLDLPPRATGTGHAFFADFGVGAATLDHETLDDAVKRSAVIVTGTGEFFEVFHRLRCDVRPEGDSEFAVGSFNDGVFLGGSSFAHECEPGANRRHFGAARTNLRLARALLECAHVKMANSANANNSGELGVDQFAEIVDQEKMRLLRGGAALAGHDELYCREAAG